MSSSRHGGDEIFSPGNAIRVKLASDTESATVVGVQDFGISIVPEEHEHVFECFFRVCDPEHETFPGLELGLFISAGIVIRLGDGCG